MTVTTIEISLETESSIDVVGTTESIIEVAVATIGPPGIKGDKGDEGQQGQQGPMGSLEELPIDPVLLFENALI